MLSHLLSFTHTCSQSHHPPPKSVSLTSCSPSTYCAVTLTHACTYLPEINYTFQPAVAFTRTTCLHSHLLLTNTSIHPPPLTHLHAPTLTFAFTHTCFHPVLAFAPTSIIRPATPHMPPGYTTLLPLPTPLLYTYSCLHPTLCLPHLPLPHTCLYPIPASTPYLPLPHTCLYPYSFPTCLHPFTTHPATFTHTISPQPHLYPHHASTLPL
ncbi:hypothetical protein OTU49_002392, partial [Cherax quadricarinatus]